MSRNLDIGVDTMRTLLAAAVGVGLLAGTPAAQANIMFNLSSVTLSTLATGVSSVGTLTGSFTTNNALSTIVSFDLVASAAGGFAGYEYTTSNSKVTASVLPSQYFQLDSNVAGDELRLYFTTGLNPSGGTINPVFSYENETSGGTRFPSGAVVAAVVAPPSSVPEPASLALLGVSMLGLAAVTRSRRKAD